MLISESNSEHFYDQDPDPDEPLQHVQIGLRGPGFSDLQYWAGLSGLAKDLKKLSADVRLRLGYISKAKRQPDLEYTSPPDGKNVYILLDIGCYKKKYIKKFATVPELLAYLESNQKVKRVLS